MALPVILGSLVGIYWGRRLSVPRLVAPEILPEPEEFPPYEWVPQKWVESLLGKNKTDFIRFYIGDDEDEPVVGIRDEDDTYRLSDQPSSSYILCDGVLIEVASQIGKLEFIELFKRALREGIYNSKNLEEGGLWDLYVDRYRVFQGLDKVTAETRVEENWEQLQGLPLSYYP